MKEEEHEDSASLIQFRSSLSQFALGASPTKDSDQPELRRSPRKARALKSEPESPSRREAKPYSPSRSPKKKRSYATPETYAHLRELNDHLAADLDVIFCGIKYRTPFDISEKIPQLFHSPGQKSAETGHHFGHPCNHFWWCLHQSGFTDTKLSPTEDFTLPDRFSLGLTNLVDRPTAEQMELSGDEQSAGVPVFLAKVARLRPRIVCFVGLQIARVVETSLQLSMSLKLKHAKTWGLRQYKMIHPSTSKYPETLFFAAPSTSGLVTQFQRPEKAKIFRELKQIVDDLKEGKMNTGGMATVQAEEFLPTSPSSIMDAKGMSVDFLEATTSEHQSKYTVQIQKAI